MNKLLNLVKNQENYFNRLKQKIEYINQLKDLQNLDAN